jgi:hypothetical protein
MQVGVFYFLADFGIDTAELARALEARDFANYWLLAAGRRGVRAGI